jgi:two-component system CheB/CheR fusion protein
VGASAGGLEALEELFRALPAETTMAFVVVTHLDPERISRLPELIQAHTPLRVALVEDGTLLEPGSIYFSPPGHNITVAGGPLRLAAAERAELRRPIDGFFRSLADDQRDNAVAIVLSGTGSDGSAGVADVKAASGMVMAQDPSTAAYAGMPESAITTGCVDYAQSVTELAAQLLRYNRTHRRLRTPQAESTEAFAGNMQRVLQILHARTAHDFSAYKKSTIRRRMERRMAVHEVTDSAKYVQVLGHDPGEADALFRELLIGVTSFFRDPAAFETLERALEKLLTAKAEGAPFRAWVSGCATGQEAYSVAMIVRDCLTRIGKNFPVQIFATDADPHAIEAARQGRFSTGGS